MEEILTRLPPKSLMRFKSVSFVVDHDLTIQLMGGKILQNMCGFMCYTVGINLHIFNPATRQLITLPTRRENDYKHVGYDPVNHQYKVVCSTGVYLKHAGMIRSELWVFVLKPGGGFWKKMAPDFFPHIAWPKRRGVCIDGVIYYLASFDICKYVLVSFHIRTEEFKMIHVPREDGEDMYQTYMTLSPIEYGGKLTLLNQTNLRDKGMLDLLVLEDAENKEWSRKTLLLQPSQLHLVNNAKFYVRGTIQNGKIILIPAKFLDPFHFLCYDLQSNDMRKIEIKGIPDKWFSNVKASLDLMFMDQCESVLHLET